MVWRAAVGTPSACSDLQIRGFGSWWTRFNQAFASGDGRSSRDRIVDETCPCVRPTSALVVRKAGFGVGGTRPGSVGRSRLGGGEAPIFRASHKNPPA